MCVEDKIQKQVEYCNNREIPYFAPNDGVCYRCHKQIYDKISMERAGSELITGCPYCNCSFVE